MLTVRTTKIMISEAKKFSNWMLTVRTTKIMISEAKISVLGC